MMSYKVPYLLIWAGKQPFRHVSKCAILVFQLLTDMPSNGYEVASRPCHTNISFDFMQSLQPTST